MKISKHIRTQNNLWLSRSRIVTCSSKARPGSVDPPLVAVPPTEGFPDKLEAGGTRGQAGSLFQARGPWLLSQHDRCAWGRVPTGATAPCFSAAWLSAGSLTCRPAVACQNPDHTGTSFLPGSAKLPQIRPLAIGKADRKAVS